jgi:hypothetical protein
MKSARLPTILVAFAVVAVLTSVGAQAPLKKPETPKTMRLYVFDCGVINVNRAGSCRTIPSRLVPVASRAIRQRRRRQ